METQKTFSLWYVVYRIAQHHFDDMFFQHKTIFEKLLLKEMCAIRE